MQLIFGFFIFNELSILLLQFWILVLVIFTLEHVMFVVVHKSKELFLPSWSEVWDLCNDRVWNNSDVEKNDNQVRLFAFNSYVLLGHVSIAIH